MPRPVVNDPQGITVRDGLHHLGFAEVQDVRVGKNIDIAFEAASEEAAKGRVEEMCKKLLANFVIEDFEYEVTA